MTESPPTAAVVLSLLLRHLITYIIMYANKCLLALAQRSKSFRLLRYLLANFFFFLLRLFPSLGHIFDYHLKVALEENYATPAGDSGIARAISQLLAIVSDLPVSSRKYDVVQSLAGRLIDENLREGSDALREVNRAVLSGAFERTLSRLEWAVVDRHRNRGGPSAGEGESEGISRVFRAIRRCGDTVLTRFGGSKEEVGLAGSSAEKLAAELLWLAQKMACCGCVEEAVAKWASATHLASLALSAEPQLQGSLVKVSAFLFKQARELGRQKGEESRTEQQRQTDMKMLTSWLPFLCRASNGTDVPVLSMSERSEVEKVLEESIDELGQEEDQEKVLSLWLHHFTYCPSSDWPNLRACYGRWCTTSRRLLAPPSPVNSN
ncbi:hypothetical protein NMG60_11021441 [Bertholletia excelsa]